MTFGSRLALLLAHQGGWDEILMVTAPIVIFAGLLWLANHRAEQLREDAAANDSDPDRAAEADDQ